MQKLMKLLMMIFYNSIDNGSNDRWSYVPKEIQNEKIRIRKNKWALQNYHTNNKHDITYKDYNRKKANDFYQINKILINEKRREKINCSICNLELRRDSMIRHNKLKHQ